MEIPDRIHRLMDKGVAIPNPRDVFIDETVDLERISGQGVTLWPGSRISGVDTLILPGASIGSQGPMTIDNCQLGPRTELKSGYCSGAVLLADAQVGANAHARGGTILEEGARTAHSVGLKQTILFPFVTLGSLINFCDVFMAGGTGPKDHSEVGSSYIHFNFTPNKDKATASLVGDVPGGVMLNREPIFLGGQGGLVGPCRLAYGSVIVAGGICRKDHLRSGQMIFEGGGRNVSIPFTPGVYRGVRRIVANNLIYIANLMALGRWYTHVRSVFSGADGGDLPEPLLQGLKQTLDGAVDERICQLARFVEKLKKSLRIIRESRTGEGQGSLIVQKEEMIQKWDALAHTLADLRHGDGDTALLDQFGSGLIGTVGRDGRNYIDTIGSLEPALKAVGTQWLESIVAAVMESAFGVIPIMRPPGKSSYLL
ncbi:MAG: protein GlmU [Desulfobacterales bacterium]|nr:protein GlmU [Desulfobacterales bacterium]